MSASVARQTIAEILDALEARLEALTWGGRNAFDAVLRHDVADLERALASTFERGQRLAIVVPADEQFEPRLQGRRLLLTRRLSVALILADQVLGDRDKALWGDSDLSPGAFALVELVLPVVTGRLLDAPEPVLCRPTRCGVLDLAAAGLEGRAAVELDLELTGGTIISESTNGITL